MAAPLMSGFIGLMLSEYGADFTRNQLIRVTYNCAVRLAQTPDWQAKNCSRGLRYAMYSCSTFNIKIMQNKVTDYPI